MNDIFPIDETTRAAVDGIIREEWHGPLSVSKGNLLDTSLLPGFVCMREGSLAGAITYHIADGECEIVTLNSFCENTGVGGGLISAVLETARARGCSRVWLITTNDNSRAIRYYQKRGFSLAAVHINSMEQARVLKPSVPMTGFDGIPILHEFEFEIRL